MHACSNGKITMSYIVLHACAHTRLNHPLRHHTHSTPISTNNPTLQHTPQDEGDQVLYDTINDTVTNLEHKEDTVQCVTNESYSFAEQRN